jgi:hypothetical protein
MKKENLVQYVLLVLITFIVVLGLVNSFKTSKNLKAAMEGISEAKELVKESSIVLKNQGMTIDSIIKTNENLLGAINIIDLNNKKTKESLIRRIDKDNQEIDSILSMLNKMKEKEHPLSH